MTILQKKDEEARAEAKDDAARAKAKTLILLNQITKKIKNVNTNSDDIDWAAVGTLNTFLDSVVPLVEQVDLIDMNLPRTKLNN